MSYNWQLRAKDAEIKRLREELARLRNLVSDFSDTASDCSDLYFIHYFYVYKKGNVVKVRCITWTNHLIVGDFDSFGWYVTFTYMQLSFFPLEQRFQFYI